MNKNRKLVLENGKVFEGYGFGGSKEVINELVFNTSVVGYQEILSDPKNYQKVMCLTYPVIGNYGLNDTDFESKGLTVSGLIVREYNDIPSNFRFTYELSEVMSESDIPGIYDVDTREITRIIREEGTMKVMICDINKSTEEALKEIQNKQASAIADLQSGLKDSINVRSFGTDFDPSEFGFKVVDGQLSIDGAEQDYIGLYRYLHD
jgi:carbamoyl-phosphate synthase small subunit